MSGRYLLAFGRFIQILLSFPGVISSNRNCVKVQGTFEREWWSEMAAPKERLFSNMETAKTFDFFHQSLTLTVQVEQVVFSAMKPKLIYCCSTVAR